MIEHVALIPAKAVSTRCADKNWRPFTSNMNLVTYLISIIPEGFFDRIILSTDKTDLELIDKVTIHNRDKSLATKDSPVNDLISKIINEYRLQDESYIWLLNPTSPFRKKEDFNNEIILGNAKKESLYDIWNGEKYAQFRKDQFNLKPGIKCTEQCDMKLIGSFFT